MNPNKTEILEKLNEYILQNIPQINDAVFEVIQKNFHFRTLKKGDPLIRQGAPCQFVYFIVEGILRYFYIHEEKEMTTWFGFENDFATVFDSFILQIPSRETIEAISDSTLIAIPRATLEELYRSDSNWERIGRIFITNYAIQLEDRIHMLHQSLNAEEKYKYLMNNHPKIIQYIPNKYVASYLGITRETLSRIRSSFNGSSS